MLYTARLHSLAGLAHHSARFPVVSPAGTVEQVNENGERISAFRLVDGGYFDNSGVQTALELIGFLRRSVRRPFHPILILVRNSPDDPGCEGPCTPGTSDWFPEVGSIIGALYKVRGAHAVSARKSAERALTESVIDLVVPAAAPAARAPLGWSLSDSVRSTLDAAAVDVAASVADGLQKRLEANSETPL